MSVNQSTESTTSSLHRSGLSITVGDTKSIVLALQALQSKIRSLEQDRDYHQDQYEVSLQAHERYKLDMERQMEQERAAHRQREAELLELLRKAREERVELEAALNGNKEDLGGFRKELEAMIAAEKELALQRESKLNSEVVKLRDDIKEEQTRRAALLVTMEKLKEEREAALQTNEQLRIAMDDLLTRFEQLQEQRVSVQQQQRQGEEDRQPQQQQQQPQEYQRRTSSLDQARRASGRGNCQAGPSVAMRGRPSATTYNRTASRGRTTSISAYNRRSTRPRVVVSTQQPQQQQPHYYAQQHHTYEDPTCSSMLRDVRVVPDEAPPCAYPSVNSSMQQPPQHETAAADVERRPSGRGSRHVSPAGGRGISARSVNSQRNQHLPQHHHHHHHPLDYNNRREQQGKSPTALRTASSPQPPRASARRAAAANASTSPQPSSALGSTAMDEVEKQLRHELSELQRQYEDTVTRGAAEDIPSEVLAAALHRVSSLIDQKKEQVKLLREARAELLEAVGGSGGVGLSASGNTSSAVGEDKATRRTMLVNELRSLLAEASS